MCEKYSIKEDQIEREMAKFQNAIKSAVKDLNSIKETIPDDDIRKHAFIIDAHILMLQDEYFLKEVIDTIKSKKANAEWALDIVVSKFLSSFEKVEDPYLRERGQDLDYIYQRLLRIMVKERGRRAFMTGACGARASSWHMISHRRIRFSSTWIRLRGL